MPAPRVSGERGALTAGLLPRDLHPANLLRDDAGQVFVIDWDEVMLDPNERDFLFIDVTRTGDTDTAGLDTSFGLLLAQQVPIIIDDPRAAVADIFQTGVVPAAINLLACAAQLVGLHVHILAGMLVVPGGQASLPSFLALSAPTGFAFRATTQIAVVIDDLVAPARAIVQ